MKFTVKGTTIRYNGANYPAGSIIDLPEGIASKKENAQYLDPVPPETMGEKKGEGDNIPEGTASRDVNAQYLDPQQPEAKGGKKVKGDKK